MRCFATRRAAPRRAVRSVSQSLMRFLNNYDKSTRFIPGPVLLKTQLFFYKLELIVNVFIFCCNLDCCPLRVWTPGRSRVLPVFYLGPKVPKKCWLGTQSCPTSRNQLHLFALPEHHAMLGPPRRMEHACQLGWVPVPTQQPKYPQGYVLKVF